MSIAKVIKSIQRQPFDMATKDKRIEDFLTIGYDEVYNNRDKTVLVVARQEKNEMNVIAQLEDEKAEKLYKILTGEVKFE